MDKDITIVNHIRSYKKDKTFGNIYLDGKWFCYSLEDVGRPEGVKIKGETCIPEGTYIGKVTYSTRFDKPMILLYNNDDKKVHGANTSWSGIRVHGGNSTEDSEGCILLGYKKSADSNIYERASDDLAGLLKDESHFLWVISSIKGG